MYEASYWNLDWTGDLQITYVEVMVEGKEVDVTSEGEKTKQNKKSSKYLNECLYLWEGVKSDIVSKIGLRNREEQLSFLYQGNQWHLHQ